MARRVGYKQPDEVKAKISASMQLARRGRAPASAEWHRSKIKTGVLINRLEQVGTGKVEASATSVQACIALLRKVIPDLASIDMKADAAVTLRTIITGVVRAEDLEHAKVIEHDASPVLPSNPNDDTST